MTTKTLLAIVASITILFVLLVTTVGADEPVTPKKKPVIVEKINNWVIGEWTDIVEYQKNSWQEGKKQTTNNFNKIKAFVVDNTTKR
jgi:hypothetical protein|tara:strand:+ start:500 stop:760 length:261 start_codon:yes stop_codon:yes gene_type:complete